MEPTTTPRPVRTTVEDGGLRLREVVRGVHPGDQHIRVTHHPAFHRVRPGIISPDVEAIEPQTGLGRAVNRARRFLLGTPIASSAELEERVSVPRGLAIFASDNISSSAYATEEIMRVLVLAGVATLTLTMPITLGIVAVLAIVVVSYLQVVRAYPGGGGSYAVAQENLGPVAGLVAAAALLTDYILTVAVSVSAGVAAFTSAFPEFAHRRVTIALVVVVLMTIVNLRGIRESGRIFSLPTFVYLVAVLGLLGIGVARLVWGTLPEYTPPPGWVEAHAAHPLGLLLLLRAFSSGAVALTGTEAVSNGVPAFRPPEVRHAQITLLAMGGLFATIFIGFSLLASQLGVVPDPDEVETVNSVVTRALVGESWFFFLVQFSTALLLVFAGNTAFNGFPMLASILARDRYLPRQFSYRGDRLAFTGGIIVLAVLAGLLIWAYGASVTGLIPLYTVGVFLAFTLSQAGLVRRWWRLRGEEPRWQVRLLMNGAGAIATGVVLVVVGISKFLLGAWMVLVLIPALVWIMWHINRHYRRLEQAEFGQPEVPLQSERVRLRAIVPVADLSLPARQAIAYAQAVTTPDRVTVVHVTDEPEREEEFNRKWQELRCAGSLVIIESPYRSLLGPLVAYIDAVHEVWPDDTITLVLPEYVPRHWWEHLLHNQTALRIKAALLFHPNVVVANVPYHLHD